MLTSLIRPGSRSSEIFLSLQHLSLNTFLVVPLYECLLTDSWIPISSKMPEGHLHSWQPLTVASQIRAINYRYMPLQAKKIYAVPKAQVPSFHMPTDTCSHSIPSSPRIFLLSAPCCSSLQATELLAWITRKEAGMNAQKLAKTLLFCNSINGRLQNYFYSRKNKTKVYEPDWSQ